MDEKVPIGNQSGGLAVGAYLRWLREAQGITSSEIAALLNTEPTQIWRVDNWKSDVRSSLIFKYILIVGGNAEDVSLLINNPTATREDGERIAQLRLSLQKKQ